jgi:hypothetical protein
MKNQTLSVKTRMLILIMLVGVGIASSQSVLAAAAMVIILTSSGLYLLLSFGRSSWRRRVLQRLGIFIFQPNGYDR